MMIKVVKNKQKKCYENNIERLQEPTRKKYRELSNEKNDIKENVLEIDIEILMEDDKEYFHFMYSINRSSPPEVILGKGILKIYSKFTGEHP